VGFLKHLTQAPSEAFDYPPDGGVKHKPSPKTLPADIFYYSAAQWSVVTIEKGAQNVLNGG